MDRDLRPRERYDGTFAVRLGKQALNYIVERLGGERPFEPIREGGAVVVAGTGDEQLDRLPPGAVQPDEQGIREQLPERPPEDPHLN